MSSTTSNLGLFKYDTTADSNVAFSITKALNNNWDIIDEKCGQGSANLLDFKWSDHLLNDMSWLRADTFSWQSGTTYSLAYNELLSEYNNSASVSTTEGSITFKRTPKGYKIALANQESAILKKYNTDGIAWFYILDTTNKKFKLPRTKFGVEGVRNKVGDDIAESLPNITGSINPNDTTSLQGYFINPHGVFNVNGTPRGTFSAGYAASGFYCGFDFDASRSSSTYKDGAPVQERATQMYLYFYVGGFTKSAEAQTAGLKAELLNGKADVSTPSIQSPYLKTTYINGQSGYNIWSNGYCEQWGRFTGFNTTITVTFLKEWKDTNYGIYQGEIGRAGADPYINGVFYSSFTTTSVVATLHNDGTNTYMWKAYGYLKEGQY